MFNLRMPELAPTGSSPIEVSNNEAVEKNKKNEDPLNKVDFFFNKQIDANDYNAIAKALRKRLGNPSYFPSYQSAEDENNFHNYKCYEGRLGNLKKEDKDKESIRHEKALEQFKYFNFRNIKELEKIYAVLPLSENSKKDRIAEMKNFDTIAEEYNLKHSFYISFTQVPEGEDGDYKITPGMATYDDDMINEDYDKMMLRLYNGGEEIGEGTF